MDYYDLPKPNMRILHIAPEKKLAEYLKAKSPNGYEPVDYDPEKYKFCDAKKIDLVRDAEKFADEKYDIILHSHVMEHIPCNITAVFYHFHRALKKDGFHIFCIPFMPGFSDEYMGPLSPEDETNRFGQFDHVRKFGTADFSQNLGMIFNIKEIFSLYDNFDIDILDKFNIPKSERVGLTGSSVFVLRKNQYKLLPSTGR